MAISSPRASSSPTGAAAASVGLTAAVTKSVIHSAPRALCSLSLLLLLAGAKPSSGGRTLPCADSKVRFYNPDFTAKVTCSHQSVEGMCSSPSTPVQTIADQLCPKTCGRCRNAESVQCADAPPPVGIGRTKGGAIKTCKWLRKKNKRKSCSRGSGVLKMVDAICPKTCGACGRSDEAPVAPLKGFETFSFYAMGDIPYNTLEETLLRRQLDGIDDGGFVTHVGDIMYGAKSNCEEWRYELVAGILLNHSSIPVLTTPGDNEWVDCSRVTEGVSHWRRRMEGIEHHWEKQSPFPSLMKRQGSQTENLSLVHSGILFLWLNMAWGSERGWEERVRNNYEWMDLHINQHITSEDGEPIRAVIVFGHSNMNGFLADTSSHHGASLSAKGIPFIFIHGNGHKYQRQRQWDDDSYRVQVDKGGIAPPIKVTVRGTTKEALQQPFSTAGNDEAMLGRFIKLDRRGGLYDGQT